jgi:hypothetical protein
MIATLVVACLLLSAFVPLASGATRSGRDRRYDRAYLSARLSQRQS